MISRNDSSPFKGTRYRGVKRLGAGTAGEVWEAIHRRLGHRVAIKILHDHLVRQSDIEERLSLEGQTLAQLDHPHLVRVYDLDLTPSGRPFVVMALLDGRTLDEEIRQTGPLHPRRARRLMLQLLCALEELHERGLIHRDIKPANLFLCAGTPQQLKVLDLGVVKVLQTAKIPRPVSVPTKPGIAIGTPRYMAPEQIQGTSVDARTDLYGAGLVLYRMLAGRGPFDDRKTLPSLLIAQTREAPDPPSVFARQLIEPDLDRLVLHALQKEPAARFASATAFASALRGLCLTIPSASLEDSLPFSLLDDDGGATRVSATDPLERTTEPFDYVQTVPLNDHCLPMNATVPMDPMEEA